MKVLICESVIQDFKYMESLLTEYCLDHSVDLSLKSYACGKDLLTDLASHELIADFIIMSMELRGENGIEISREIRTMNREIPLLFTSRLRDWAVESYEVQAAAYFLKPVKPELLFSSIDQIFRIHSPLQIAFKCKGGYQYLNPSEISHIEIDGYYTLIHLQTGSSIRCSEKMSLIESRLASFHFLRCHHSFLVNMDFVKNVTTDFILKNGTVVPIRTREHKKITDAFYQYFVEYRS